MPKRLVYRIKTEKNETVTLYPPRLHTFEQILNYIASICKQIEKGFISETQATTIKELISVAIEAVRKKQEFEKYDEVVKFREKDEEEDEEE